ncbi:hypothetical protein BD780_000085 [Clostridium tetanomorphum]|nr:hypothetical protein [Clostridium tetanomorphum]
MSSIYAIIGIIFAYIAFPQMPFTFNSNTRFSALLPGNGWNHFSIVALLFAMPGLRKNRIVQFSYLFVCSWFLMHYERVDILGLIIAILLIYVVKTSKNIKLSTVLKVGIIVTLIFIILSYVGERRTGNVSFGISDVLAKLVSQNTASDIGYVYNSSCDFVKNDNLLYGKTYLTYIEGLIPLVDTPYRAGLIIKNLYNTPGGEFILTEPLINFGMLGVIIIPNIYLFIFKIILKKRTVLRYNLYIFLIVTAFRYLWYGFSYIETAVIWFIPLLYLLYKFLRLRGVSYG